MKTFEHPDQEANVVRAHPWTVGLSNPAHKYYDFKVHPGLIRTSLEDFVLWNGSPAIETFYDLLEWLNGPKSLLESNDCGTRPPHSNSNKNFQKSLEWSARLMILYRHLPLNTRVDAVEWLARATRHYLTAIDPLFEWGVVGTTLKPTAFITLPGSADEQLGSQLLLTFWAWGDTEEEVAESLNRTIRNTRVALENVCREIAESMANHNGT